MIRVHWKGCNTMHPGKCRSGTGAKVQKNADEPPVHQVAPFTRCYSRLCDGDGAAATISFKRRKTNPGKEKWVERHVEGRGDGGSGDTKGSASCGKQQKPCRKLKTSLFNPELTGSQSEFARFAATAAEALIHHRHVIIAGLRKV